MPARGYSLFGLFCSIATLVLGLGTNIWHIVPGFDEQGSKWATVSLSGICLALGFYKQLRKDIVDQSLELTELRRNLMPAISSHIPHARLFVHYTRDDATHEFVRIVNTGNLKHIRNTGIYSHNRDNHRMLILDAAIFAAIEQGLIFSDVVGENRWSTIQTFHSKCKSSEVKGKYIAARVDAGITILNFFLLTYVDNTKEVWFGWPIKEYDQHNAVVLRTSETHVVHIFEELHAEMLRSSTETLDSSIA